MSFRKDMTINEKVFHQNINNGPSIVIHILSIINIYYYLPTCGIHITCGHFRKLICVKITIFYCYNVVMDRFSKMCILIPCNKQVTTKMFAQLFFQFVWVHFGLPTSILSDHHSRSLEVLVEFVGTYGHQVKEEHCIPPTN